MSGREREIMCVCARMKRREVERERESACACVTVGAAFKNFRWTDQIEKSCLIWQILVCGASKTVDRPMKNETE